MNIFNILFPTLPSKSKIELKKKKQIDLLIYRFSHGNIRLQMGKYFTKKEAIRLKESVLKYHF